MSDHIRIDEAAEVIGVSRPAMYRLARTYPRDLRNWKWGRYRVFDRAQVIRFAEKRRELTQL